MTDLTHALRDISRRLYELGYDASSETVGQAIAELEMLQKENAVLLKRAKYWESYADQLVAKARK